MILLFTTLFLFRQYGTSAAPVVTSFPESSTYSALNLFTRDDPSDADFSRSAWDIAWSCLATTFAVTWVSVHPNVPWLEESSMHLLKRRIFLMCLALLAPEVMIMWAFKQWQGAVTIMDSVNRARPASCQPWTMAHAHFLQMGGFKLRTLDRNDNDLSYAFDYLSRRSEIEEWEGVLTFSDFKKLLMSGKVSWPDVSEVDIVDRSKRDALSKGFALLQISWFIIQLIARAHQHLDITEIELTTAALAGLNSVMYLFWWNKPSDVRCPIIIRTKKLERQLADARKAEETAEREKWTFPLDGNGEPNSDVFNLKSCVMVGFQGQFQGPSPDPAGTPSQLQITDTVELVGNHRRSTTLYLLYLLTFLPIDIILGLGFKDRSTRPSFKDAKDKIDNDSTYHLLFNKGDMKWIMWMMFYSEKAHTKPLLFLSALAGATFGSIHCIAWNSHFSSHIEQVLWRTASLTIVGVCLCTTVGGPLFLFACYMCNSAGEYSKQRRFWNLVRQFLMKFPTIIYPLARFCLLILSLISLHNLPESALQTVKWTNLIPHI